MDIKIDHNMNGTRSSTSQWWFKKWFQYNKALLFTGLMGLVILVVQQCFTNKMISSIQYDLQISGTLFIFFLMLANVAFAIGAIIDTLFNAQNSLSFRDRLFCIGYWFAIIALILFIIAFLYCTGPLTPNMLC